MFFKWPQSNLIYADANIHRLGTVSLGQRASPAVTASSPAHKHSAYDTLPYHSFSTGLDEVDCSIEWVM